MTRDKALNLLASVCAVFLIPFLAVAWMVQVIARGVREMRQ